MELKRLGRGHDSMDGGALWIGRALVEQNQVWLALWSHAMDRFQIVLDTCRQRGIFCDTRMEYRPPVSLPRPYMQVQINIDEHASTWKEILTFALNSLAIHVIDLRAVST